MSADPKHFSEDLKVQVRARLHKLGMPTLAELREMKDRRKAQKLADIVNRFAHGGVLCAYDAPTGGVFFSILYRTKDGKFCLNKP